jgi:hypothetical protein
MSLEFGESQTYTCTGDSGVGVFSPVAAPHPDRVHVNLNLDYTASEYLDMRRIPNMFTGSTPDAASTLFDEMPGNDEVFGEIPGVHIMFIDEEGMAYMNDLIGGGSLARELRMLKPEAMRSRRQLRWSTPTPARPSARGSRGSVHPTLIIPRGNLWKMSGSLSHGKR